MHVRTRIVWFLLALAFFALQLRNDRIDAQEAASAVDPDHAAKRTKGLALFQSHVGLTLKQKCVSCHGESATEGKLDLATQEGLLKGGERGPAVVIGRGDKSLLTRLISHRQEPKMPKDDDKLSPEEISKIVEWIDLGAPYAEPLVKRSVDTVSWTDRKVTSDARKFWSYQPLNRVSPPPVNDDRHWVNSPIDRFILSKLNDARIQPNEPVDRAALARRLYFDIIGLPPSSDDVQSFVDDPSPDACERLIDRLLANPHYGERWGRRWLDLARFAESHGFEHDSDRPSAFHYRDFVVQALNAGMPYDQFIRWQIAGDELAPNDRLALMATGYLAAGVHSTQITKNEVEKHRYDEMDDMLGTIGTSMLGMTIGCARCHDHKFDAIPQADYYRLLSTFTTTVRSEVELDFDPDGYEREKLRYDQEHVPFEQAVQQYEAKDLASRFTEWLATRTVDAEESPFVIPARTTYQSQGNAIFTRQPDASWRVCGPSAANDVWTISLETKLRDINSIRLETLADSSLVKSGPGRAPNGNFALSDFAVTIEPLGGNGVATSIKLGAAKATFEQNGLPVAAAIDDNPNSAWAVDPEFGKNHAAVFTTTEPFGFEQGTLIKLTLRFNTNVKHSIGRPRVSLSRQAGPTPTIGGAQDEAVREILQQPFEKLTEAQRVLILDWYKPRDAGWKNLDDRRAAHAALAPKPRVQKVLIASEGLPAVKLNTQAEAEFLKETHFLRRGETNNKESVATQSFLQVLMANPDSPQIFQSPPPAGWRTSFRRASLANWLTDREAGAGNLLARVIANRVWQHHFGRGIVATPSDFGTRGELPTHPEMLDWIATELVRHEWNLKPLHRTLLSSNAYRQSCDTDELRTLVDRDNKLIWHRPRRRLEAEIIRDAILASSDLLDDRLYGPGRLDEGHRRRSLYFTVKRSQLMPSMTVFDAPDGTTPVADRPETTIAPQALMLMNNPQVRDAARQFAARLQQIAQKSPADAVKLGYLTAISRPPTPDELTNATEFLSQQMKSYSANEPNERLLHALADFCQVLFCLNEFIYTE